MCRLFQTVSLLSYHPSFFFFRVWRNKVPAGLYTVQNNLAYYAMTHLDAATYQLLYQLKILTTALFSVLLLNKTLSTRQWGSLMVLCLGVGLVQTSSMSSAEEEGKSEDEKANSFKGLAAVVAACCSSGLAGVYFEMVLKNAKTSLWVRNIQLGALGLLLGLLPVVREREEILEKGFFFGYTGIGESA
jgi:UDP-sugar transporter A1/2/3